MIKTALHMLLVMSFSYWQTMIHLHVSNYPPAFNNHPPICIFIWKYIFFRKKWKKPMTSATLAMAVHPRLRLWAHIATGRWYEPRKVSVLRSVTLQERGGE